jgi:poly(hydroxyalkanoate) granule-associated protein
MVKKLHKTSDSSETQAQAHAITGAQLAQSVKESAQQIWLAGLGAFSKAQAEGGKVFETLVKDGMGLQRKTQAVAEEKISEATSKMADMASGITSKATGQWDKLENIFEERVAKALNKMGMPTAKEVQALAKRVDELSAQLKKAPAKVVKKPAVNKPVVKTTTAATKTVVKKAIATKKAAVKSLKTMAKRVSAS